MVQHIDLSWNHIEASLVLMYEKLVDLGFVYYDGEIRIIEPKTEESKCNVWRKTKSWAYITTVQVKYKRATDLSK